ncbi:hypothetical protein CANARDRAFT_29933 [[Candida] arabinofermentans NRRL YB-2248]|uniref:Uncharacterized protein n=1 Tax=[Candida] arabinofermentans NRRL YB-2248 TaxID=983967 RepID=A0A1E4SVN6_9ASCO|nr:hypothetical protein CANARDRAFT_29933 [[Candida] arabinofermentans NRRL YB-2248]
MLKLESDADIPAYLITYVEGLQQSQFGDYPDSKDVAPSAIFLAIFIIFFLIHTTIFGINWKRGHKFPLSLGFAFYCLLRWIGFTLRLVWAKNLLKLHVGIASEVFLILPTVFIASFNLVLAQRIFTWKHPVGGNTKLFWTLMLVLYSVVAAVVLMTIVAGVVPYLYFLSRSHYNMCRNVVKVTSLLITLYSLLAIALVLLAFVYPSSQDDKNALVYQPFWITSFAPTYFAPKGAAQQGRDLFVGRHQSAALNAKRTIVTGGQPSSIDNEAAALNEYENLGASKFSLKHNNSIIIIALTSFFVFIGALFRCITMFLDTTYDTQSWITRNVVMYVLWGALETIVNLLYIVGRVDLRFYRPDAIPASIGDSNKVSGVDSTEEAKDNSTIGSVH